MYTYALTDYFLMFHLFTYCLNTCKIISQYAQGKKNTAVSLYRLQNLRLIPSSDIPHKLSLSMGKASLIIWLQNSP